jgi:polyhydroxyalkanoate synthesis regulator phasin
MAASAGPVGAVGVPRRVEGAFVTRTKPIEEEAKSHEDFLALFKRGLKFTEELLAENEKLRFRIASVESELETFRRHGSSEGEGVVRELKQKVRELEDEKARLLSSYKEVETLNRDYQARYAEIEEEHNNLANLYIASYQLHSTMTFREVVQVINEIVINLVGVSRFAMYLLDAPTGMLHAIAAEGYEPNAVPTERLGEGIVGTATKNRQRFVADGAAAARGDGPLAVVPLATLENIVGAISIEKLLVQKEGFNAVDNELFNLLSVHAATALLSGLLRDQVGDRGATEALTIGHARKLLQ